MSLSPEASSWRIRLLTTRSIPSASIGRLRRAMRIERSSFSRSKSSRWPPLLITLSSRSCTRSKVVKRAPQPEQSRRRRIVELSSVGRESLTWASSLPQNGHRIPVGPQFPENAPNRGHTVSFSFLYTTAAAGGTGSRLLLCLLHSLDPSRPVQGVLD